MAEPLELRRSWIAPGGPDPFGIDAALISRKQARLNGLIPVRTYERRRG